MLWREATPGGTLPLPRQRLALENRAPCHYMHQHPGVYYSWRGAKVALQFLSPEAAGRLLAQLEKSV